MTERESNMVPVRFPRSDYRLLVQMTSAKGIDRSKFIRNLVRNEWSRQNRPEAK